MKFGNVEQIETEIQGYCTGKYETVQSLREWEIDYEDVFPFVILELKRLNGHSENTKTLLFVDVSECILGEELKIKLREVMNLTATIKEQLPNTGNVDLYLFLALPKAVSRDECVRIESMEQLCRKYVLMPDENISDFLDRTFLSSMILEARHMGEQEPIARVLAELGKKYGWMSEEIRNDWKEWFLKYSDAELLVEKLIDESETQ